ncbi:tenascin-N-like isoform X2 [Paramacrobiotus metropolitanus]|nr:tenascin-N-like isoform X2 [Paramacrobiotus metropolitanus]XP_055350499.1 tenascin-N-like isoform X2 [Paramacrobiotus metropolitanus]XP_055350569.1 tenascin-N-like isoform X2 [Paramacrobiotus metropolitanus]
MSPEQCTRQFTAHCAPPNHTIANCSLSYGLQINCDNQADAQEVRQLAKSLSQSPLRAAFINLTESPLVTFDNLSPVRLTTVVLHLRDCVTPRATGKLQQLAFSNLLDFELYNCYDVVVKKTDFWLSLKLRLIQFVNTTMRSLEVDTFTVLPALRLLSVERGFDKLPVFSNDVGEYIMRLHCSSEYEWLRDLLTGSQLMQEAEAGEIFRIPMSPWKNEEIEMRDVYHPITCEPKPFPVGLQIQLSEQIHWIHEENYLVANISAKANLTTTNSITLKWSMPLSAPSQGYQILYQRHDADAITPQTDRKIIDISNASITTFNVTGLQPGSTYSFRMRSIAENQSIVETTASLYCTRPLTPNSTVQRLPIKLMVQIQKPHNTTKYYRVILRNLDVKDEPVREISIRNDSLVVNYPISLEYRGATYEVRVAAVACDLFSEEVSHIVRSSPPPVMFFRPPSEVTQTSIKFYFQTAWRLQGSFFTRFVFSTDGNPPKYVLRNDEDRHQIELTGFTPGTKSEILGWTEQGDVQSEKRSLIVQLKPNNVTVLNATKISSSSIDFTWESPVGIVGFYEIGYNNTEPIYTNATSWSFTGLRPSTVYAVYVTARCGTERSSALTKFFKTLP